MQKAEREAERARKAENLEGKIDAFLNYCVTLDSAWKYLFIEFGQRSKKEGRPELGAKFKASVGKSEVLQVVNEIAGLYKHRSDRACRFLARPEIDITTLPTAKIEGENLDLSIEPYASALAGDEVEVHFQGNTAEASPAPRPS